MYERILVVLDGNKETEALLGRTGVLAAKNNAEVVLLMVLPRPAAVVDGRRVIATLDQEAERMESTVQPYLRMWKGRLNAAGVKATVATRFGDPSKAIAEYTKANNVGLIVMNSGTRKGLGGLIRRSLVDKVIHSSPAPVLLMNAA